MLITLQLKGAVDSCDMPEYDAEIDDHRSLLINVCEIIQTKNLGIFRVGGFGEDCWPVDIATDLPVFLEQLPQALESLDAANSFEIDFYEQGIERILFFSPYGEQNWKIACASQTSWIPDPETVVLGGGSLEVMLQGVYREFTECVKQLEKGSCPWAKPVLLWKNNAVD